MLEQASPPIARAGGAASNHLTLADTVLATSKLLSADDRSVLADTSLSARSVKAGYDLLREGDTADSLYFLVDGWACRYKLMRDGSRQLPALLMCGSACKRDPLSGVIGVQEGPLISMA